jgi:hypothetical protein
MLVALSYGNYSCEMPLVALHRSCYHTLQRLLDVPLAYDSVSATAGRIAVRTPVIAALLSDQLYC